MLVQIDDTSFELGTISIAFRYAACEAEGEVRAALLAIAEAIDAVVSLGDGEGGAEAREAA